ncbi:hypothetical protein LNTAR_13767 [Lentisphaera araneosa HTCC2155]|jgi:hypothetical protein|uniref:Uncharacterized protein n=1 Tax=Lentisphaera araneosa HTCC2155 TaxID=313628 RepID=A6DH05_9BACT|nr:hypothetical protein LNTAR_13767 [Lentisphaera araneosa HTCC2155]
MIFRALSFYLLNFFFVAWAESFCASKGFFLPLSAIYVFYLTVSRGIYQSLIASAILLVLVSAICSYNNALFSLGAFFVAYLWRDMGDCQSFPPQILPIFCALLPAYLLEFGLSSPWLMTKFMLPSIIISSLLAPLFLWFWDFISDSLTLPRFSVLDNYAEDV